MKICWASLSRASSGVSSASYRPFAFSKPLIASSAWAKSSSRNGAPRLNWAVLATTVRRDHDFALHRQASHKPRSLSYETYDYAVAAELCFDHNIFEAAGGEQTVDRTGDLFRPKRFALLHWLCLCQIVGV